MKQTANVVRRRRQRRAVQVQEKSRRNIRTVVLAVILLVLALISLVGVSSALAVGIYVYYARDLPNPDDIVKARQQFEITLI